MRGSRSSRLHSEEDGPSPALTLIKHVARHATEVSGRSNIKRQQAISSAIRLACESGMRFAAEDFAEIHGYSGDLEGYYGVAVENGNRSACIAIEERLQREPFIRETGARLYVGDKIAWRGYAAEITSFPAAEEMIACVYDKPGVDPDPDEVEPGEQGSGTRSPKLRFRISRKVWMKAPNWWKDSRGKDGHGGLLMVGMKVQWDRDILPVGEFSEDMQVMRLVKERRIVHTGPRSIDRSVYVDVTPEQWSAWLPLWEEKLRKQAEVEAALTKDTTIT